MKHPLRSARPRSSHQALMKLMHQGLVLLQLRIQEIATPRQNSAELNQSWSCNLEVGKIKKKSIGSISSVCINSSSNSNFSNNNNSNFNNNSLRDWCSNSDRRRFIGNRCNRRNYTGSILCSRKCYRLRSMLNSFNSNINIPIIRTSNMLSRDRIGIDWIVSAPRGCIPLSQCMSPPAKMQQLISCFLLDRQLHNLQSMLALRHSDHTPPMPQHYSIHHQQQGGSYGNTGGGAPQQQLHNSSDLGHVYQAAVAAGIPASALEMALAAARGGGGQPQQQMFSRNENQHQTMSLELLRRLAQQQQHQQGDGNRYGDDPYQR